MNSSYMGQRKFMSKPMKKMGVGRSKGTAARDDYEMEDIRDRYDDMFQALPRCSQISYRCNFGYVLLS